MQGPDLNLLVTLDVLLAEGSVARAAKRLRLSPSAMSRSLARLRDATGDPLLVRAGRGLVPTPRAIELRARVGPLVEQAQALLRPAENLDLGRLSRSFTLASSDGFVENFGAALIARIGSEAPDVRLRFVPRADRDGGGLRDGSVDLEIGVISRATGPELRAQALYRDRFVGAARAGHPLSGGKITPALYASAGHILVSRRGGDRGPVDEALAAEGLQRKVQAVVGGFAAALALARESDLVVAVPERHTGNLRVNMFSFALPVRVPEMTISLLWHPRLDSDAAQRWLRDCIRDACRAPTDGLAPARSA